MIAAIRQRKNKVKNSKNHKNKCVMCGGKYRFNRNTMMFICTKCGDFYWDPKYQYSSNSKGLFILDEKNTRIFRIHQIGIFYRGRAVIILPDDDDEISETNQFLMSGFFEAIQNFSKELFHQFINELTGNKYIFIFSKICFRVRDLNDDNIIGFTILNNRDDMDICILDIARKRLDKILLKFQIKYNGCNLTDISVFKEFEKKIIKIYAKKTKMNIPS